MAGEVRVNQACVKGGPLSGAYILYRWPAAFHPPPEDDVGGQALPSDEDRDGCQGVRRERERLAVLVLEWLALFVTLDHVIGVTVV